MSGNSTSFNESLLDSFLHSYLYCYTYGGSSFVYSSFLITNICLLLPMCTFILHHGHQQRKQKAFQTSGATISHADCFTYHMVTMELIGVFGCVVCFCGIYKKEIYMIAVGDITFTFTWFGEMFFQVLTCVEHYLAVVNPSTYLKLRTEKWIRRRNVTIGLVWLCCIIGVVVVELQRSFFMDICLLVLSLAVESFCSLSVLCVLIHPGPGERGRDREGTDQLKQKAFNTIVAILGALVVRGVSDTTWEVIHLLKGTEACLILSTCTLFSLPSSLVLPLLFLHRSGKFMCCKKNTK